MKRTLAIVVSAMFLFSTAGSVMAASAPAKQTAPTKGQTSPSYHACTKTPGCNQKSGHSGPCDGASNTGTKQPSTKDSSAKGK